MANLDQTQKPGWLQKVLIVSLGLNLFLAGFIVARSLDSGPFVSPEPPPMTVSLSALPQDIPPELRESMEENFRKHSREVGRIYGDLIEARFVAREVLQQEELDQLALEEALADVRELQIRIQGPLHEALVEAAAELDVKMRRELVLFGETFDRGVWQPRNIDGARWSLEFDNGEFVLDFKGFSEPLEEEEDGEGEE